MGQIFLASLMMTMLTIVGMLLVMVVIEPGGHLPQLQYAGPGVAADRHRHAVRGLFRLHPPPVDDGGRPAGRGPGQPGDVQAHPRPADRFLRAHPGRRDHVPARPYQQGARLPHRPRAEHPARRGDAAAAAAGALHHQSGADLARPDRRHHHGAGHRGVHPPGPARLPALRRRRDRQVHRAGRERARHPHGQVAGAGAAAQGGLGQRHRRRRQLEAGTARPGQLAADPGPPAGNLHALRRDAGRRLHRHRRHPGCRLADGLHDAERPAVAADRRPRPHDGGDRGHPHCGGHGRLGDERDAGGRPAGHRPAAALRRRDQLQQGQLQLSRRQDPRAG